MADVGNGAEAEEAEEVSSGAPVRLRLSGAEAAGWYRLHSSCHVLLFTPLFLLLSILFPPVFFLSVTSDPGSDRFRRCQQYFPFFNS